MEQKSLKLHELNPGDYYVSPSLYRDGVDYDYWLFKRAPKGSNCHWRVKLKNKGTEIIKSSAHKDTIDFISERVYYPAPLDLIVEFNKIFGIEVKEIKPSSFLKLF